MLGENALAVDKHIYDYVITDSKTEKKFARNLDVSKEVSVYAKLPSGFFIPQPVDKEMIFNTGILFFHPKGFVESPSCVIFTSAARRA